VKLYRHYEVDYRYHSLLDDVGWINRITHTDRDGQVSEHWLVQFPSYHMVETNYGMGPLARARRGFQWDLRTGKFRWQSFPIFEQAPLK
jgi:hypothetical protein